MTPLIFRKAIPKYTLDDALLEISTFPNGCDYTLRFDGRKIFVIFGCYGVHVNLVQGDARYLLNLLQENGGEFEITNVVKPETIVELKNRKPCLACGGFTYRDLST